jgi:hypothetical protein
MDAYKDSFPYLLPKTYSKPYNYDYSWLNDSSLSTCNVQILRSLNAWSGGICQTETSILKAHYKLIDEAENYVYIEVLIIFIIMRIF